MSTFSRYFFAVLVVAFGTSCKAADDSIDGAFKPARGWILVGNGSVVDVEEAIRDYDGLVKEERPGRFKVELHPQGNGTVAVVLPDGLPAYDLANMTGWLSAPPGQEEVYDAVSWITSPGDGARYYFEPETGNPWGDTLVGASLSGRPVRVYLPETGLSEVSASHAYREEPEVELSSQPVMIEITLDTSTAFGNPRFIVNSPKDHDWRP